MQHKKISVMSFMGLALVLFCGINLSNAQTAQQIAKKAFNSTVLLVMEDTHGQPLGLGSGFFVRNGQVATNLHVVEGSARGYAKLVGKKTKYDIEGITAIDARRDLVLLKVSVLGAQSLALGNSDMVQVGESVYAVGNPHGLEGTFSQGIISSVRRVGTDKLLQLTAPISPGSSGGPVLNGVGEVIGVSVATFRSGQNLNFAIPSNYVKVLLTQVGHAQPFPQGSPAKSRRSLICDQGMAEEPITASNFSWASYSESFSFSLRNHLRENVKNIDYLIIFYDEQGDPIDVNDRRYDRVIRAGLAKRITDYFSDYSVRKLSITLGNDREIIETRMEFRVLNFEVVE